MLCAEFPTLQRRAIVMGAAGLAATAKALFPWVDSVQDGTVGLLAVIGQVPASSALGKGRAPSLAPEPVHVSHAGSGGTFMQERKSTALGCHEIEPSENLSPEDGAGWGALKRGDSVSILPVKEKDAQALFEELDADKSGFLDSEELGDLCRQMGKKLGRKELAKAMAEIDLDGNDEVSFPEFEAWWKRDNPDYVPAAEALDAPREEGIVVKAVSSKSDGGPEWETLSDTTCLLEPVAQAEADDVKKLKHAVTHGHLRRKGIAALQILRGQATFFAATLAEVHEATASRRGCTVHVMAADATTASKRSMGMYYVKRNGVREPAKLPRERLLLRLTPDAARGAEDARLARVARIRAEKAARVAAAEEAARRAAAAGALASAGAIQAIIDTIVAEAEAEAAAAALAAAQTAVATVLETTHLECEYHRAVALEAGGETALISLKRLYGHIVEQQTHHLGGKHESTLLAKTRLGIVLGQMGEIMEAQALLVEVVEEETRLLSEWGRQRAREVRESRAALRLELQGVKKLAALKKRALSAGADAEELKAAVADKPPEKKKAAAARKKDAVVAMIVDLEIPDISTVAESALSEFTPQDQQDAAIKIQSRVRGNAARRAKARKRAKSRGSTRSSRRSSRGSKRRMNEEAAAVKIQSRVRGNAARRKK